MHVGDGAAFAEGLEHITLRRQAQRRHHAHRARQRRVRADDRPGRARDAAGLPGRSTPYGSVEEPFNPLELLYVAGATYLARGYSHGKELLKTALQGGHRCIAASVVVDTLQVCVTFRNMYESYNERVYELDGHDPRDERQALAEDPRVGLPLGRAGRAGHAERARPAGLRGAVPRHGTRRGRDAAWRRCSRDLT